MTDKKPNPKKRFVKMVLVFTAVVAIVTLGLHIWFVNNARKVLKQMVAEKSHGRLQLELSGLSYNFFTDMLQVRDADIRSTDSITQAVTYNVRFDELTVHVNSFWPLLFKRKLYLDSIHLDQPRIEVVQWRRDSTSQPDKSDLSVPQQMGKLYNSMLDALEAFGIRRIGIDDAQLSLVNKMEPESKPVLISDIQFDLWRKGGDQDKRDEFVQNEQDVVLTTSNQQISLPSGRHHLSFKNFNLQLFRKRIVLDSCTVTAFASDSARSSYRIFFDKLLLIGVDFDAMYRYNLIRADSVYCEKPFFEINLVPPGNATANGRKKEKPDLEKMVRELTGDLDLRYVGVKEAGIHIDMGGPKKRTLFNSSKDNFEVRGFRINADSVKPVVVERFDMLVRDYHLYNDDSSTAYSFDSIHFINNKIALNNFTVKTQSGRLGKHNERDFRIPYFELTGMDWFELVFNQNLKAEEAFLYNPVIYFKKVTRITSRKKTNFFASLQTLDSLMTLDRIKISNGQLSMDFGQQTSFELDDVNMSLHTNELMRSTNREGLRKAVEYLSFSRGRIRLKDISAQLRNIRYTGANLIHADQISINSTNNRIKGTVNDVYIDNMLLDDQLETILVDGLRWQDAQLSLNILPSSGKKGGQGSLDLKNIRGRNTRLALNTGGAVIHTTISHLNLASVHKDENTPLFLDGLSVGGSRLTVNGDNMQVRTSTYEINSGDGSFLSDFSMQQARQNDSLHISAPHISFQADINAILSKDIHLTRLAATRPVIRMHKNASLPKDDEKKETAFRIDAITATEPSILIVTNRNDSLSTVRIPWSANSSARASGLKVDASGMSIAVFSLNTTSATLVKGSGDTLGVSEGKVDVEMNNILLTQKDGKPSWSATVNNLSLGNPNTLSFGKKGNRLTVEQFSFGNLNLSSDHLTNLDQLIRSNVSLWLKTGTGQYTDSNTTMNWFNADYSSGSRVFSLDSFRYRPTQPRDSVMAHTPYQKDYITFQSGRIRLTDFSLKQYEQDSALKANTLEVQNPVITIYRDKQPPFRSGIIKPLPVNLIKNLDFPISIQRLALVDGHLSYTEKHPKTRVEGTLTLNHLNGSLSRINNDPGSSDSLALSLNAYLMDSAYLDLRVKESYLDSLGSFVMTLRMRPTSLSFLNPVLAPFSNVMITSGTIDSFHLRAIGNDYFSFGEMRMFYRGLKIRLIKDGDPTKSSFGDRILSTLVNTFVVKKNNDGRTGLVYFERLRDRSFFNYIIKTTFSGIATSIGVKKNKKYRRKYNREMKEHNLPQIEY